MINTTGRISKKTHYPILEENVIVTYCIGFQEYYGRITTLKKYKEDKGRIGFSGEERFYKGEYVCIENGSGELRLLPSLKMCPIRDSQSSRDTLYF